LSRQLHDVVVVILFVSTKKTTKYDIKQNTFYCYCCSDYIIIINYYYCIKDPLIILSDSFPLKIVMHTLGLVHTFLTFTLTQTQKNTHTHTLKTFGDV